MEYLYLGAAMLSSAMLSIMSSLFGKMNPDAKNSSLLYSVLLTGAAVVTWGLICVCKGELGFQIIGYSVLYGIFYTVAMIGMFKAYQTGVTSLTAFVKQLSLILVAVWGFAFWGNQVTVNIAVGLLLIIAALYFCFGIKKGGAEASTCSLRWFLYAAMLLCGNAGCSIVQKYQNIEFKDAYGNTFMLFGVLISFICCMLLYLKKDRCKLSDIKHISIIFPFIGGVSSGLLNLLILLLITSRMSESIIFPGIAVGGLILTILFSTVICREKITKYQWIGLGVGLVALVFLNF